MITESILHELEAIVGAKNIITKGTRLDRNSRDCYWYSPVLKKQLDDKTADLLIQPETRDELVAIVTLAVRERIPIVPRGAGTGNYGQSIPIHGGIMISTKRMNRILDLSPEAIHVQAGVILHSMEMAARKVGAELRFFPSTLPTSTAAGFVAGGSAGIGSIKWGNVWDAGNIVNATVVTVEDPPQVVRLSTPEAMQSIIHNCGLTAIIADLTFALAPRQPWQQYIVAFDDFTDALRFGEALAFDENLPTRLISVLEWPIPSYFIKLRKIEACPDGKAVVLLHLTLPPEEVTKKVTDAGGKVAWHSPEASLHRGGSVELTDYSWNHTTLWALKADENVTYLQDGYDRERLYEQLRLRKERYGDDVLEHVTFSRSGGVLRPGGLPLVRYHSDEHLMGLMAFCESIGIAQYSPHTTYLDEDDRWSGEPILQAKARWDPYRILNPGHLRSFT
ncbi:MAG: FAD-binding oxidoreductase [Chloroflexota bacterium]